MGILCHFVLPVIKISLMLPNFMKQHSLFQWEYLRLGKAACPAKKIPENLILESAASVLGLDSFDPEVFKANIKEIRIPGNNRMIFIFHDGAQVEREWQDKSRSASRTPEMRKHAAETILL